MRSRVIGGEFELKAIPNSASTIVGCSAYASGRAALYQILNSVKLNTSMVWLPDWLCESMIDAVRKTRLDYGFYRLGHNLRMDVIRFVTENRPVSENDVIVLVNYFGLTDVEQTIAELRAVGVKSVVIEDDVQALFTFFDKKPHAADYRFTSLRKTIAAPDGGLVKTQRKMPIAKGRNTFSEWKVRGALVKGKADKTTVDNEYLNFFKRGEELIEENYDSMMSREAVSILIDTDLVVVEKKRKENSAYLVKQLREIGIEPLLSVCGDDVPLFVPILIENRNVVRQELRKKGIFCPVHWPLREDMLKLPIGRLMAEKELSLVVDQRYGMEEMDCIVKVLKDTLCNLR